MVEYVMESTGETQMDGGAPSTEVLSPYLARIADEIASLEAEGLSPIRIAGITGIKSATIQEVKNLPIYKELLKKHQDKTKEEVITDKYSRIENAALKNIEENLPMAEIPVALKVLQVVNERRALDHRAKNPELPAGTTINVVNIALPPRLVPNESINTTMTLNANREIIAIGDRNLAPLPMSGVHNLFADIEKQKKAAEKARGHVNAEDF